MRLSWLWTWLGKSVSVHTSAWSQVLGKGNSASAICPLPYVQGGVRGVCISSVRTGALLGLEHCGKQWDHC